MMKVTLDIDPKYEQDEIIIRCAEMSDELLKLVALAGTSQKKGDGKSGETNLCFGAGGNLLF